MRKIVPALMIATGVASLAFAACSSSTPTTPPTTSGTGGGTTGVTQTSTGTKTMATTTVSASGAGGAGGACAGIVMPGDACGDCTTMNCCDELAACSNDSNCTQCLSQTPPAECNTDALLTTLSTCQMNKCATPCAPPPEVSVCNPVTNEGCADPTDPAAECDFDGMSFQCFSSDPTMPNVTAVCGGCNDTNGPFCLPGATCSYMPEGNPATQCAKYCCTDADCGGGVGSCNVAALGATGTTVGVCLGGGDAGATAPTCSTPATPPSNGSCFVIPAGAGGGGQGGGSPDAGPPDSGTPDAGDGG